MRGYWLRSEWADPTRTVPADVCLSWSVLCVLVISYTAPARQRIMWYMPVEGFVVAMCVDRENEEMNAV